MWRPICPGVIHYLFTRWWQHLNSICALLSPAAPTSPRNDKDSHRETYLLTYYLSNYVMIDPLLDYPRVTAQRRASSSREAPLAPPVTQFQVADIKVSQMSSEEYLTVIAGVTSMAGGLCRNKLSCLSSCKSGSVLRAWTGKIVSQQTKTKNTRSLPSMRQLANFSPRV